MWTHLDLNQERNGYEPYPLTRLRYASRVEAVGFEPTAISLQVRFSARLSYALQNATNQSWTDSCCLEGNRVTNYTIVALYKFKYG